MELAEAGPRPAAVAQAALLGAGAAEAPLEQEFYELREASTEKVAPELPVERRRASARNLERVVPIGERRTVDDITVALASLELFGEGLGILRYLVSYETGMFEVGYGIPEPELVVRDVDLAANYRGRPRAPVAARAK